jgi:glutamate dehydrogenase/leucine dehydrogenase
MGALVVALADKSGAFYAKQGFHHQELSKIIKERKSLSECKTCSQISSDEFWALPVDILIPASVTDVINNSNKDKIKVKIIVEAGNIPMKEEIEEELFQKGILIVPDFVANAGGVISSYTEYRGYNPKRMFETVKKKITKATKLVLKESIKKNKNPRFVALEIAKNKIEKRMYQS